MVPHMDLKMILVIIQAPVVTGCCVEDLPRSRLLILTQGFSTAGACIDRTRLTQAECYFRLGGLGSIETEAFKH